MKTRSLTYQGSMAVVVLFAMAAILAFTAAPARAEGLAEQGLTSKDRIAVQEVDDSIIEAIQPEGVQPVDPAVPDLGELGVIQPEHPMIPGDELTPVFPGDEGEDDAEQPQPADEGDENDTAQPGDDVDVPGGGDDAGNDQPEQGDQPEQPGDAPDGDDSDQPDDGDDEGTQEPGDEDLDEAEPVGESELPFTGGDDTPYLVAGLALTLIGIAALSRRRRRGFEK